MKSSIHTYLTKAIVPAVLVAGLAVPAALAGNSYPDAVGRAVNAQNAASYPDAVGRAVNVHNSAAGQLSGSQAARTLGTPDTRDAAAAALRSGASQLASSLGTPDTRDAAQLARSPVVTIVESGGFDWADAGIGAGGGIAFLLVLAAGGSMLLRGKARLIRA